MRLCYLAVLSLWISVPTAARAWEHAELLLQVGHSGDVNAVAYSPDGQTLASAGSDGTIRLWDASSGELLRILTGHKGWVNAVAYAPDGQTLASASTDRTICLWDARSGQLIRSLKGQVGRVNAVAYAPDEPIVAAASFDGMIRLWNAGSGELLRTLTGHDGRVNAVVYAPDGQTLASAGSDRAIRLWDARSGRLLRALTGHADEINAVTYAPDGQTLASAGVDGTIRLWDAGSGDLLRTLTGHEGWVNAVTYALDGQTLASAGADGTIRLWDAGNGELLRTLTGDGGRANTVAFAPDGQVLAAAGADGTIRLWNAGTGERSHTLTGHTGWLSGVAFFPDGQTLAAADSDGAIRLWNTATGELLRTLTRPRGAGEARDNPADKASVKPADNDRITAVACSPAGQTLASAGADGTIRLWNPGTGELLRTLKGHEGRTSAVAFAPNGQTLASSGSDGTIRLWDATDGRRLRTLKGHQGWVNAVAYLPDGRTLASASSDGTARLWNTTNGRLLRILKGHEGFVTAVAYLPGSQTVASGSSDGTIRLWNGRNGEARGTLTGHLGGIYAVACAPNGNVLASAGGDGTIRLWSARNRESLHTLTGHNGWVSAVAYSPDGHTLASAGSDRTVRLWDAESGAPRLVIAPLPGGQWLAWQPGDVYYNASQQGDEEAAVRFDHVLRPLYPLHWYRNRLLRPDLLDGRGDRSGAVIPRARIAPRPVRLWWQQAENKGLWFGGLLFVSVTGAGFAFLLRQRSDPAAVARRFFAGAGFAEVKPVAAGLLLARQPGADALVALWEDDGQGGVSSLLPRLERHLARTADAQRIYLVYRGGEGKGVPEPGAIQALRSALGREVIPLPSPLLDAALREGDCRRRLEALEEPYLIRTDPYLESKPISDPTWFYGRRSLLDELPRYLAQGQHVGLFGLRKVGKTSVLNQVRQRLNVTPLVYIDCQSFSPCASILFEEILARLRDSLAGLGVNGLPPSPHELDGDHFRRGFLALFECWERSGRREPVVVILDEVDKLFPGPEVAGSEAVLAEYVQLFRVLRGLAQSHRCLATLVVAYRPDVNRRNLLTPAVGENPMFNSFREVYLGLLAEDESEAMVREIGLWKGIHWTKDAARRVFHYCGGHPLATRFFASEACRQGRLKDVDLARVEETTAEATRELRRNDIGNYYKEGVWALLYETEQQILERVYHAGNAGLEEATLASELDDALTSLEHFGVVANRDGRLVVTADLFRAWLQRRIGA